MFFQGTLQEGITAALQQSKSVVCFVTDSGTESQQWEEDFLPNSEASSLIGSQAVLLRLEAGSQEEGFLAQLYPIPKKPTIVIIKNGELREYIAAGVTKDDFVRRVKTVLEPTEVPAAPAPQPVPRTESSPTNSSSGQATPSSSESQTQQTRSVPADQSAGNVTSHPSTSSTRAEDTPKRHAEETKVQNVTEPADSTKKAQAEQQELVKKKQKEAREERQRILKAIEDDKIARHARKAELEAERRGAASAASDDTKGPARASPSLAPASKPRSSNGRLSENCAIQVRLLDGSTIRNRFSSTGDTIQSVRKWVDEARTDGKTKYTFKILLTPLPSKTIEAAEETKSLRALKLAPSATLILVPAAGKKYTRPASSSATAASTSSGTTVANNGPDSVAQDHQGEEDDNDDLFKRLFAFLMGIINVITGFFSSLFSTAGPPQPVDQGQRPASQQQGSSSSSSATTTGRAGGSRIKGLERHRQPEKRNEQQQFYNGNSTNFEPRPDDKDE
ncbi:UBX domain-containing protein 4 [Rhypophila decipiens]|uniref:UBX domain-containing protein 2 n=1 Tax=Rhypophila decipiens TaxID=261697 RepID=A0AAN6XXZ7_9PEZI|nr:UBX domain-containing protein 4 [Rhypophila decipiens]